ncbi:DUF1549 domain-containing protein [Phragmitibacter flavus]|uniref:DUF1549 domain-containing protein n=1 Tax=Phragmitibacter flavus TaxID=2576071 RepID=A0A5R8K759_9BACT|nr:PSD1 and planctomycete cytochrome C domain-containing protein [Phragmitibacter flavus]TLD68203.1 DUF1549 domain-containing protein [Phragmitibacter flavus]
MKKRIRQAALPFLCLLTLQIPLPAASPDAEQLFVRRIKPLFSEKCLACHGNEPEKIKGGFDMRSREAILKGGDSDQPGLITGNPEESPLYLASTRRHDDWEAMPPKEADQLYAEQLQWIKDWIAGGAPWPDDERVQLIARTHEAEWAKEDGTPIKTSGGLSPEWTNRKYQPADLWAYQPVIKPHTQSTGPAAIDELIALHFPPSLQPSPAADPHTFIRRATFDLTGLPPTPEEVKTFTAAHALDANAAILALIDRLLDSPHYGERLAQHWLDVVRYADSSGFANDYERGNAWRYRDYVVRAFNDDKPYRQFIQEQIAGDELASEPSQISNRKSEMLIATGFLRMGPWELTGMEVPKIARQRFLDDVTNSVGETFLAHSLQCARCHDHKFDPVPTIDYYSIQAVFATTQIAERDSAFLPTENTANFDERRYLQLKREEHQQTLTALDKVQLQNAQTWFQQHAKDPAAWNAAVEQTTRKRRDSSDLFTVTRHTLLKQGIAEDSFPPKLVGFTPEQFGMERAARKGLERLRWEMDRYEPYALAVYNGRTPEMKSVYAPLRPPANPLQSGELEQTSILTGGDPFSPDQSVKPGVLSVVDPTKKHRIPDSIAGRRKAFAAWIADDQNPLTSRAIVNRIWLWHFDQPIAGNPNNFGGTGKKPTHPELLDWLAATFVEQGGSFKKLHRLIMTSAAYQRSSQSPKSTLAREDLEKHYATFKPRRLSAEELRDTMLATSGELNPPLGGIPNRPEINLEAAMQPRQVMGTFASAWVPNPQPAQRHRRSLYALKLRGLSDPMLEVFNLPGPDFSCERRETSTVTPQVFALFNSQNSHARALALAHRVLIKEGHDHETAIQRCFTLIYQRPSKSSELTACLAHWRAMQTIQSTATFTPMKPPLEVRHSAVEENTGEKFTLIEKLHANADFIPDLQPSDCDARTRALADVCLVLLNTNEFAYVY